MNKAAYLTKGYIYKLTNNITKKAYIGQRRANVVTPEEDVTYMGGGPRIKAIVAEYGKENFTKEILWESSDFDLLDKKEREFILKEGTKSPNGYNVLITASRFTAGKETRDRMSQNMLGDKNPMSRPEVRRKHSLALKKGRIVAPSTRQKLRDANTGQKRSDETRAKMSRSRLKYFADKKANKEKSDVENKT